VDLAAAQTAGALYRFGNIGRVAESIRSTVAPEKDIITRETGPLYRAHYNTVVGGIRSTEQEAASKFPVYTVYLFDVQEIFQDIVSPWNRQYDAAQSIFGPGPSAIAVRTGIRALQAQLYRRGSSLRTRKGYLTNGDDFLQLMKYGIRAKHPRFYTYTLRDDKLNFSETGAEFFRDFTSKHVVHSNCSEVVRFAGDA